MFITMYVVLVVSIILLNILPTPRKQRPMVYKDLDKLNSSEVQGITFHNNTMKKYIAHKWYSNWYLKHEAPYEEPVEVS